jgi:hypothetical protein
MIRVTGDGALVLEVWLNGSYADLSQVAALLHFASDVTFVHQESLTM